jgi:hypothetical protein
MHVIGLDGELDHPEVDAVRGGERPSQRWEDREAAQ